MKKTLTALALLAALGSAALLSGCGGSKPVTLDSLASSARAEIQSSARAAASSTTVEMPVVPDSPSYPVGPAGSTLRVWSSATTFADVTVAAPTFLDDNSGVARIGVSVKATQGAAGWISEFSVINQAGVRVNQWDFLTVDKAGFGKAALNSNTSLVSGEVRAGFVYFSASDVSKIYLGADNGTKAMWTVQGQ